MFRKSYEFIKKHKNKGIIAGAVYGGVYAYNNSPMVRIAVDQSWNWMWSKMTDLVPVLNTTQNEGFTHYSRSRGECDDVLSFRTRSGPGEIASDDSVVATTLQLLEECYKIIESLLNIDLLRQKISENPPNKMDHWEEMKILAWTRCFVSIYTSCHLVVFIKVQTGVSGRFLFLQQSETEEQLNWKLSLISRHMQHCTEYPVHQGLIHLVKVIKSVVIKPVAPRPLQEGISLVDIKQITYEIRKLMETKLNVNGFVHPRNYHLEFVIPPDQLDQSVEREPLSQYLDDRILLSLTEDANRALESVDCNMILNCCLELCFSRFFSEMDLLIKGRVSSPSNDDTLRIPHVALLPALDRMSHLFAKPVDAASQLKNLVGLSYFSPFVDSIIRQSLQRDSLATTAK